MAIGGSANNGSALAFSQPYGAQMQGAPMAIGGLMSSFGSGGSPGASAFGGGGAGGASAFGGGGANAFEGGGLGCSASSGLMATTLPQQLQEKLNAQSTKAKAIDRIADKVQKQIDELINSGRAISDELKRAVNQIQLQVPHCKMSLSHLAYAANTNRETDGSPLTEGRASSMIEDACVKFAHLADLLSIFKALNSNAG